MCKIRRKPFPNKGIRRKTQETVDFSGKVWVAQHRWRWEQKRKAKEKLKLDLPVGRMPLKKSEAEIDAEVDRMLDALEEQ